jgi:uncharacterized membrane protein
MKAAFAIGWALLLAVLVTIAVVSAITRGLAVTSDDPGALDRQQIEGIVAFTGLEPGSSEHLRLQREIPLSAANLNARPAATLWHIGPGALFMILVTLQFSRRLRARHPAVHRWNGRAILAMVAASGVAGMYLGLAAPYGGFSESAATTLFGGWFVFCAARGWAAIRRRDMAHHREWMIRMFAIGIGISVIRVVGIANALWFGAEVINARGFALSLWVGWLLSAAVAELWILRTRTGRRVESEHALQPL